MSPCNTQLIQLQLSSQGRNLGALLAAVIVAVLPWLSAHAQPLHPSSQRMSQTAKQEVKPANHWVLFCSCNSI
jgi:hypothetical protein